MKKLFTLFTTCLVSIGMMAQTSLVATLTHQGESSEFYGQNALVDAVKASADGDLITLSAGIFSGTTINKSLTIRGNGAEPAEQATVINSKVVLEKSADEDEANHWLNIEGINFNCEVLIPAPRNTTDLNILKDLCMKKCTLKSFSSGEYYPNHVYYGTLKNASFINCRIIDSFTIMNESEVAFINSVVRGYKFYAGNGGQTNNPKATMYNSVLITNSDAKSVNYLNSINSVIVVYCSSTKSETYAFPSTFSSTNSIITGFQYSDYGIKFADCYSVNTEWKPMEEVFSTLTDYRNLVMENDYALTESAQAFLGTDGTQVGIYGGAAPYTSTVSYPRFKTFKVADKAVNGKLSVEIATE